jgi:hypothetical protein
MDLHMHNVQLAIRDLAYASALRDLLVADGQHVVYVVDYPSPAIDGIVVVDDTIASRMTSSTAFEFDRCVVFIQNIALDVNQLWEAGVRHVIYGDYPPDVGQLVVLAAERRLGGGEVIEGNFSTFDATDRLFLQRLRITDS